MTRFIAFLIPKPTGKQSENWCGPWHMAYRRVVRAVSYAQAGAISVFAGTIRHTELATGAKLTTLTRRLLEEAAYLYRKQALALAA